jgi:hypothetical protein
MHCRYREFRVGSMADGAGFDSETYVGILGQFVAMSICRV